MMVVVPVVVAAVVVGVAMMVVMDGTYSKRKERSPTVNKSPSRRRWALSAAYKWLVLLMVVGFFLDNVLREAVKAPPF